MTVQTCGDTSVQTSGDSSRQSNRRKESLNISQKMLLDWVKGGDSGIYEIDETHIIDTNR